MFNTTGPENTPIETIADGEYNVNGIDKFIGSSVGANGEPCMSPINGEMRVMLKLRTPSGQEGPAWSGTIAEYLGLVNAFGGDFTDPAVSGFTLNKANRDSSIALHVGKRSANRAGKTIKVYSDGGWAKRVPLTVPERRYKVRFVEAFRKERDADFPYRFDEFKSRKGGTYKALLFKFEIAEGLYEGFPIIVQMSNPFVTPEILADDDDNQYRDPRDQGEPLMLNGYQKSGSRWNNFAQFFAPSSMGHGWAIEPKDSAYNVSEVFEPQFVLINAALKDNKVVDTYIEVGNYGPSFDLADLHKFNAESEEGTEPLAADAGVEQPQELLNLINYIEKKWSDQTIFDNSDPFSPAIPFTKEGIEWAKEHFASSGVWEAAGLDLTNRKPLHLLTAEEVTGLHDALIAQYGDVEAW